MICPKCRNIYPEDANFCGLCGAQLVEPVEPPQPDLSRARAFKARRIARVRSMTRINYVLR